MNRNSSFVISEFTNPSGAVVFRVSGYLDGQRVRKNFRTRSDANAECQVLELKRLQSEVAVRATLTRLSDDELREAESVFLRLKGLPKRLSFYVDYAIANYREPAPSKQLPEAIAAYVAKRRRDHERDLLSACQLHNIVRELKVLEKRFPNRSIASLAPSDLVDHCERNAGSLKSYNLRRAILSTFFKFARQSEWLETNPIEKVAHHRIAHRRGSAVTLSASRAAEVMEFVETLEGGALVPYFALWGRLMQERQATAWPNPSSPGAPPNWDDEHLLTHYGYYDGSDLLKETGNWGNPAFKTNRFSYDGFNRVVVHTHDNDTGAVTTYTRFDDRGLMTHRWGSATHPVRYDYDTYGRQTKLHTYRANGSWTGSAFPATDFANSGEETTWNFDGPTGLVAGKTDAKGKTVNFTYNERNQLATRTWARLVGGTGNRVTATYNYNNLGSIKTGDLASTTYNDDGVTSAVSYTYERDGQLATVSDETGLRTFHYDTARNRTREVLPSSFFGSREIAHAYFDGSSGSTSGYLSKTAFGQYETPWAAPGGGNIAQAEYQYDWTKARLGGVHRTYNSGSAQSFAYGYETNGYRVASISSGTTWKVEYGLQGWRNLTDGVATFGAANGNLALKASYISNYDWRGQRTDETLSSGPLTQALDVNASITQCWRKEVTPNVWFHGYNSRGEVTGERVYHGQTETTAKRRDYAYDNGWNRSSVTTGSNQTTYTISAGNEIDVTSGYESANYSYDLDGNLTGDQVWTYTYDAENRLKTASRTGTTVSYIYDYLGRRVRKTKTSGGTSTTTTFVFDGWNLIAELDVNKNAVRTFTWGLDANGTIRGGGSGGLLMISEGSDGSSRLFPIYDCRHNVTGLLDPNGAIVAAYTYDSFGRISQSAGVKADANPFRFATQYTDTDIDCVYFGHRFYNTKLGRFINRDPIAEAGGLNLYAYCGNDGVNSIDTLGLGFWVNDFFASSPGDDQWFEYMLSRVTAIDILSGSTFWGRVGLWDWGFKISAEMDYRRRMNKRALEETATATKEHVSSGQKADIWLRVQSVAQVWAAAESDSGTVAANSAGGRHVVQTWFGPRSSFDDPLEEQAAQELEQNRREGLILGGMVSYYIVKEGSIQVAMLVTGEIAVYYVIRGVRYVMVARSMAQAARAAAAAEKAVAAERALAKALEVRHAALDALGKAERSLAQLMQKLGNAEKGLNRAAHEVARLGEETPEFAAAMEEYLAIEARVAIAEGEVAAAELNWQLAHEAVLAFP